jgi:hypothetical protein
MLETTKRILIENMALIASPMRSESCSCGGRTMQTR